MKRGPTDSQNSEILNAFPSLEDLILVHIVSSFSSEAGMQFYLAAIPDASIRSQISERWHEKCARPDRELVHSKRRFIAAEVTMHYVERREIAGANGARCVISQTKQTRRLPLTVSGEMRDPFAEIMMSKFGLDLKKSSGRGSLQFVLY